MKKENFVPIALEILKDAFKEDPGFYYSWQSNIAMSFQDSLARAGYTFPDAHTISNDAAKQFLNRLMEFKRG